MVRRGINISSLCGSNMVGCIAENWRLARVEAKGFKI